MHIRCKALWLQKDGNAVEDYEDAFFPVAVVDEETSSFRCAIADGATESSFAGLWANILVEGMVYGTLLSQLRREFMSKLGAKTLPWYAEEKMHSGAFAAVALLSVKVDESGLKLWQSEAIGDCCIMHVRENLLLKSFPLERPEAFNNSPILIGAGGTLTEQADVILQHKGEWLAGDRFYLMTDALACWTLTRLRDYQDAFELLEKVTDLDSLKEFVACQRAIIDEDGRPSLKNDDVTLIRVMAE